MASSRDFIAAQPSKRAAGVAGSYSLSSSRDMTDDLPPSGAEAKRQAAESVEPLIWTFVGLVLVVGFMLLLRLSGFPT